MIAYKRMLAVMYEAACNDTSASDVVESDELSDGAGQTTQEIVSSSSSSSGIDRDRC
jgi:hypothetical protein